VMLQTIFKQSSDVGSPVRTKYSLLSTPSSRVIAPLPLSRLPSLQVLLAARRLVARRRNGPTADRVQPAGLARGHLPAVTLRARSSEPHLVHSGRNVSFPSVAALMAIYHTWWVQLRRDDTHNGSKRTMPPLHSTRTGSDSHGED
jgi:hypothetical protein